MPPPQSETLPRGGADPLAERRFADALEEARSRTLALVWSVHDADLERVHDPLMSPLVWDLGHIAAYEDLWVCRCSARPIEPLRPDLAEVYDASESERCDRGDLPYLRRDDALAYLERVRERTLSVLAETDLSETGGELNAGGFAWDMLVQHEHQHNETMIQTL